MSTTASTLDPRFTADPNRTGLSLVISEPVGPTGGTYSSSFFDFDVLQEVPTPGRPRNLPTLRTTSPAGRYNTTTQRLHPFGVVIDSQGFADTTAPIFVSTLASLEDHSAVMWMPDGRGTSNGEPTYTPVFSKQQTFDKQTGLKPPDTYNLPAQLTSLIRPHVDDTVTRVTSEDGSWSVDLLEPYNSKPFRSDAVSTNVGLGFYKPVGLGEFAKYRLVTLADLRATHDAGDRA